MDLETVENEIEGEEELCCACLNAGETNRSEIMYMKLEEASHHTELHHLQAGDIEHVAGFASESQH